MLLKIRRDPNDFLRYPQSRILYVLFGVFPCYGKSLACINIGALNMKLLLSIQLIRETISRCSPDTTIMALKFLAESASSETFKYFLPHSFWAKLYTDIRSKLSGNMALDALHNAILPAEIQHSLKLYTPSKRKEDSIYTLAYV